MLPKIHDVWLPCTTTVVPVWLSIVKSEPLVASIATKVWLCSGQNVLQRDVSSIAGVTEVTIRNRCKEILTNYKLKITLRPSLAKY